MAVLWHEGFRIEDIAKQVKVNSTQLARKIMAARKLCGEELFPRRHLATKDVEKRNQHASSLWKSGFSLTEISDQVGIKVGLLRYLITCSRGRGLSLFPLRS